MPNIKPLYDNVLVQRVEARETTAGGIVLPDSAKEKPTEGRIVAVGDGKLTEDGSRVALSVNVGDRIIFGSYAGTSIKEEGQEYLILGESEILAIVDEKPFPKAKAASKGKKKAKKS